MWWNVKDDQYRIPGDIPKSRHTLLQVTTKFNIYFMLLFAVAGGAVFVAGLVGMAQSEEVESQLDNVPEPIMLMVVGLICFSLFFPFFMALFFGRHFLQSVMRLEDEIAKLNAAIEANQSSDAESENTPR